MPLPTIHPGKALLEEMLERNLTLTELSRQIGMDPDDVREILMEHADVTPEAADKLAAGLGSSSDYWLNLQRSVDSARKVEPPVSTFN